MDVSVDSWLIIAGQIQAPSQPWKQTKLSDPEKMDVLINKNVLRDIEFMAIHLVVSIEELFSFTQTALHAPGGSIKN